MPHQALICTGCGNEVGLLELGRSGDGAGLVCPVCDNDDFGI